MKKLFRYFLIVLASCLAIVIIALLLLAEKDASLASLKPKYTNEASQFLPIMGMQLHYRDEGPANDSLPLLVLHGMSSSLNTWDSVALLMKAKKRIISMDLPAFGLTGPNTNNEYSFDFYTQFLDSFLTKLKIKECIIAGNSLGGAIAWDFAATHPEKLKKLILINSAGYQIKKGKGSIGFAIASIPGINQVLRWVTPKMLVRKSLEGIYFDKALVTDSQVERFHDVAISQGNRKAAMAIFTKGLNMHPEKISSIQQPTLIIWGAEDQLIPVDNAFEFQKNIKGSKLSLLPKIGHVPMEEDPKTVARLLTEFIQ